MTPHLDRIRAFVARQQRRWILQRIAARLTLIGMAVALVTAGTQCAFSVLPWTVFPLLWDLALALGGVLCIAAILDAAVIRPPLPRRTARRIEDAAGVRHPLLSIALDLARQPDAAQTGLTGEACRRAAGEVAGYPANVVYVKGPRATAVLGSLAVAALTLALLRPSIAGCWRLPLDAGRRIAATVLPGTVRVPRGSPVDLSLNVNNRTLPSCVLELRDLESGAVERQRLRADAHGRFVLHIDRCVTSFAYQFRADGAGLNADTVHVTAPPSLYRIEVSLAPPAYVGLPARRLAEGQGSFDAFAGTKTQWRVASHEPLQSARLIVEGGDTTACEIRQGEAVVSLPVNRPVRYTFSLRDSLGQSSDSLPVFTVGIIPDRPPLVHLLQPGRNKELSPALAETLAVEAVDDLGIRGCTIGWRRSTDLGDTSGSWDLSPSGTLPREWRRALAWDLKPLRLYPGDTVWYWATARDSKPFGPPQTATTDTFWLRVPSFGEIQRSIARAQDQAMEGLSGVRRDQQRMKEELSDLISSVKDGAPLSWEEKKAVSDMAQELAAQRDSLQKAVTSLQEMTRQLREQGMSSQSLLEKMESVRKAVQDLVNRYGDSLLFQAPRPDERMAWQDVRAALQSLEKMLPSLEESLDKTLQYLAMLQRDQELASLAARAEELGRRDRDLAGAQMPPEERFRAQRDVAPEQEKLLDDIRERMRADTGEPMLMPGSVPSLPQVQQLADVMRQDVARRRASGGDTLNRMGAALASLAEELRSQLSSNMAQRTQREAGMLLDMARDVLSLAEWQDQIRAESEPPGSPGRARALPRSIRSQQGLRQAVSTIEAALDSLSMAPPEMLLQLARSLDRAAASADRVLAELGNRGETQSMGQCSAALNGLAQQLMQGSSAMESMMQGQQGQGAEGMMSGLRRLSGKQAAINAATGELLRMMLSGQGTEGGSGDGEQARQSARAAQQAVADRLRELSEQYGQGSGEGMDARVKELQEEAERLARMLDSPTDALKDRQDRFLVRMLQTALSMHKQDEGNEERKSQTAAQVFTPSPASGMSAGGLDTFYRLRAHALRGNYPREYRAAVEAYLDSLESAAVR